MAEQWRCSAQHIRNMIWRCELQAFLHGGMLIRITPAAVIAYKEAKTVDATCQ
ncbi:hypothetical protein [Methylobacterium sp. P1-11]|uniref:hypothetical protein n=1 Tax=Methylobacterium sp. P1-11 TaxID=2024616 RepID=UPI0015630B0B|nr:hypothetical protein [Methylobacterium sp. P1-11]